MIKLYFLDIVAGWSAPMLYPLYVTHYNVYAPITNNQENLLLFST